MRIRKILKAFLVSTSFTLIGCIAESNSDMLEEDDSVLAQESKDSTIAQQTANTPPRPSDNMNYGNLFQGGEANFNVHTGLEEDETAGKWYITNDNEIGGQSNVYFPVPLNNPNNFDENISYCGGFCDTIKIVGNISTPYAGIGVNLVNINRKGADITDWGGIVIDYVSSHHPLTIALIPEGVTDLRQFYHYDLPACPGHRAIRWSEFAQVDESQNKRNKEEDLKHIAALQFVVGGIDGDMTFVQINSLGTFYLREGEMPHEFVPASSSFYMEPKSSESVSSSSGIILEASSSSSESYSSTVADYSSAAYSSSQSFKQSSSSMNVTSSAATLSSSGTANSSTATISQESSSSGIAFPASSSEIAGMSSFSFNDPGSSSSALQWTDINGGWGGWGGF